MFRQLVYVSGGLKGRGDLSLMLMLMLVLVLVLVLLLLLLTLSRSVSIHQQDKHSSRIKQKGPHTCRCRSALERKNLRLTLK